MNLESEARRDEIRIPTCDNCGGTKMVFLRREGLTFKFRCPNGSGWAGCRNKSITVDQEDVKLAMIRLMPKCPIGKEVDELNYGCHYTDVDSKCSNVSNKTGKCVFL